MRISDWSSDVCSSDLSVSFLSRRLEIGPARGSNHSTLGQNPGTSLLSDREDALTTWEAEDGNPNLPLPTRLLEGGRCPKPQEAAQALATDARPIPVNLLLDPRAFVAALGAVGCGHREFHGNRYFPHSMHFGAGFGRLGRANV